MTVSLASLLVQNTKAQIYTFALGIANAIGLPVSSWQAGDPTRSLFYIESETLETLEGVVVGYIQSGFLDFATGMWLTILADQVYGVTVPSATYATCDVIITNQGGAFFGDIEAGDLTFKSTISGKTYRNTTGGTLASGVGQVLTVTVVADEAGSASSAGAGEIAFMVTPLGSSTCTNPLAAIGVDQQSEATTRQQCRDSLGALSPNGPKEAYSYVARNPLLAGTNAVTRVRVYGDSSTGNVTVYLAGPAGAVSAADLALVQAGILKWATPLCTTPTVLSATSIPIAITYTLHLYKSANKTAAQAAADVTAALTQMFAARPIGGDIVPPATTGAMYTSLIAATIKNVFPQAFNITVSVPSSNTPLTNGQVAALGVITPTINIVVDP